MANDMATSDMSGPRGLHRYAVFAAACTLIVILTGAAVTGIVAVGAGAAGAGVTGAAAWLPRLGAAVGAPDVGGLLGLAAVVGLATRGNRAVSETLGPTAANVAVAGPPAAGNGLMVGALSGPLSGALSGATAGMVAVCGMGAAWDAGDA